MTDWPVGHDNGCELENGPPEVCRCADRLTIAALRATLAAEIERRERAEEKLSCGHHSSLLVKSVESDYSFCDLCECRRMRNDAERMESEYRVRAETAERALSETKYALAEVIAELREQVRERDARIAGLEKDAARIDAVQAMTKGYGHGWILRESSSGRGMRLHETSSGTAHATVRDAIDAALTQPALGEVSK